MTAVEKGVIRIGTRKSRLAMIQTKLVSEAIKERFPDLEIQLVSLVTRGDRIQGKPLAEFGGKGVFVEEFEQALLSGEIDMAVHSAKDMPMELSSGLEISAVLKREDPRDVLVTVRGREWKGRPMLVGTGSPRRRAQLLERMDAECRPLRGNVDTRLQKLLSGEYDGIVLAAAGLKRLGFLSDERFSFTFLPEREFIPAGGQGIIAIEAKADGPCGEILKEINDEEAMRALVAERRVLSLLNAGCHAPVGVFGGEEGGRFTLSLMKEAEGTPGLLRREVSGKREDFLSLAEAIVKETGTVAPAEAALKESETGSPAEAVSNKAGTASPAETALKEAGTVALVGAGPGEPGLLTLRGRRLLEQAEVLIYDRLASEEFLQMVPETCEKLYVGKTPGQAGITQEEINGLLVEKALEGKRIVRLKGGDSFVFGRGGEEFQALEAAGIPCEVVPGVTSAVAALESAGIPVTHRGVARSFHVITGHTDKDSLPEDMALYGRLSGTLVFLMGLSRLEAITAALLEGGKAGDTPAAVVTDGTLPTMRVVRGILRDIAALSRREGLRPPGILVVGPVAAFCFAGPLSGLSIGITGTDRMQKKLAKELESLGAKTVLAGRLRLVPEPKERLEGVLKNLKNYRWLAFTSQNAVALFFASMKEAGVDLRALGNCRLAVIGPGTGEALKARGFHWDYMPEEYTAQALAEGLCGLAAPGERILLPRARGGSAILPERLAAGGLAFDDVPLYDTAAEPVRFSDLSEVSYVTFASGSGVRGFFEKEPEKAAHLLKHARPVCIGAITEAVLREYGVTEILTAREYTARGIARAITEDRRNGSLCL